MGDVAVGARSGHDGEEHRGQPVQGVSASVPAADSAVTPGSDSGAAEDGTVPDERAGRWRGTGKVECGLHGS